MRFYNWYPTSQEVKFCIFIIGMFVLRDAYFIEVIGLILWLHGVRYTWKKGHESGMHEGSRFSISRIIDIVVFPIDLCDNVRPQRARKLNRGIWWELATSTDERRSWWNHSREEWVSGCYWQFLCSCKPKTEELVINIVGDLGAWGETDMNAWR
jgi:hypothetical protein